MGFEPELGQMFFSNAPWAELPVDGLVESGVFALGELVKDHNDGMNPALNTGGEYENDVFAIRSYCWCDGDRHPDGCPPNFECDDFKVRWYKHAGRGASQNREISLKEWTAMLSRCLDSVPFE